MKSQRIQVLALLASVFVVKSCVKAFSVAFLPSQRSSTPSWLSATPLTTAADSSSFIDTQLRTAAMKLHTKEQAPREGQAKAEPHEPYTPTRKDYLHFLVDSQHVYQTFEDIVNEREELAVFRNTGLERVEPLEQDIEFMTKEYGLARPDVGKPGIDYANLLKRIDSIPELICHYYNFYFAHTAGGRMIGKQMSALLLNNLTLEFYKVKMTTMFSFLSAGTDPSLTILFVSFCTVGW